MPNIFKRFLQPNASDFVFPDVEELVEEEIIRLRAIWHTPALAELPAPKQGAPLLSRLFTPSQLDQMDLFDKIQLENVIRVCCDCSTRTEAGRKRRFAWPKKTCRRYDQAQQVSQIARRHMGADPVVAVPLTRTACAGIVPEA